MTQSSDAAGGREWNPYELAKPIARGPAVPPPLSRTPPAAGDAPYAAPRAPLATPMAETDEVVLAGRLPRLLAVLIDAAMLLLPAGFLVYAGYRQMGMQVLSSGAVTALFTALALLLGFSVWNIVLLVRHGQTVGKRAIGLRIARPDGSRAGFWRIVLLRSLLVQFTGRLLGAMHPFAGLAFSLGNVLMIFREDRRCLHDLIADTIVVEAR